MTSRSGQTALRWCAAAALAIGLLWFALRAREVPARPAREVQSEAPPAATPASSAAAPNAAVPASSAVPVAAGTQPAAPAAAGARPLSSIRIAYESELRDADAATAEARIRQIFADEAGAEGVLREVRCGASVCKIDARWSKARNRGYNAALLAVIKEFSKQMSFESGGLPEGMVVPMTIYVRRPARAAAAPAPANQTRTPAP